MISGSIVALETPMLDDGSIDWDSTDALLEMHTREGTGAIVSVGTTGESATLSVKEHCAVIAHAVKQVDGAIPVIAGTGANSTAEAVELTAAAKDSCRCLSAGNALLQQADTGRFVSALQTHSPIGVDTTDSLQRTRKNRC